MSISGLSLTGLSSDLLAAWASTRGVRPASSASAGADVNAPVAPWVTGAGAPTQNELTDAVLAGGDYFDLSAAQFADQRVEGDYRKLFALYSGLRALQGVTDRLSAENVSRTQKDLLSTQFNRGVSELSAFFQNQDFENVRLVESDRLDSAQTALGLRVNSNDYVTRQILRGSLTTLVPGLDKNAAFTVQVKSLSGTTQNISVDLSQMGSIPRSFGAVVSFINQKLIAAGVSSRIEAVNQAPKTETVVVSGKTVERRYSGPPIYALKVSQRGGEKVAFQDSAPEPAFYALGQTAAGAHLIKLQDTQGAAGEPLRLTRPGATVDAIGADIGAGLIGAGAPYVAASGSLTEKRTTALLVEGDTLTGAALRTAGEAQLRVRTRDGRTVTISTAWRDLADENWRTRTGETQEAAIADDLAERLTQLLHEQGVAAGVDVWRNGAEIGLSLYTTDETQIDALSIGGKQRVLVDGAAPTGGLVGGLRAGIFARRYEQAGVATTGSLFTGAQTITVQTPQGAQGVTIDGGTTGHDAATLVSLFNDAFKTRGIRASVDLVDVAGSLTLRVDSDHEVSSVSANLKGVSYAPSLVSVGAWGVGGLPNASAGEPFGDGRRTYNLSGTSPLLAPGNDAALDIEILVDTPTGQKTISVNVSGAERLLNPDIAPGQWDPVFQTRLNDALNAAGVYVGSTSGDFSSFVASESAGHRIASITINGAQIAYDAQAPSGGVGGAFNATRSFTSSSIAATSSDVLADLVNDPTVSITLDTVWGQRTISASLQGGDPRTLDSAVLRLNEALAAAGYDAGVTATALSGGGTGLRVVSGSSFSVRGVDDLSLGGVSQAVTLDPIDVASRADDPVGAASVAQRAARGAAALSTTPSTTSAAFAPPNIGASNWFAGRSFDNAIGGGAKVLAARATAVGADGSVYVLADIANAASDQPVKGASDVALLKYDSAGALLYTRTLGAADTAQGFALAVAADGRVAVAGSVTGALQGANASAGKADSFVTVFDSKGAEAWTARRGASQADQVNALAFAADGTLFAVGKTDSAFTGQVQAGGTDSYLRAYSSLGLEVFTRQFGTSGADSATALSVRDAGAGVSEIVVGGVENLRGVLRSFSYTSLAGVTATAQRDIGDFRTGAITSIVSDGADLFVGGSVRADKLSSANVARAATAGLEGFVLRVDDDLSVLTRDRATYLGSTKDDGVAGLAVAGGAVYAYGQAAGAFAGVAARSASDGFLARLDANGDLDWARSFATSGGGFTASSIAVDASGASALDRLGLPRGALQTSDSTKLIDRSALRAGDEFKVAIDGGAARTVRVSRDDTLLSLAARLDRTLRGAGQARVVRDGDVERIEITGTIGRSIDVLEGAAGRDALGALGLKAGVIAPKAPVGEVVRGALRTFGLGFSPGDLDVSSDAAIKKTKSELAAATSILRQVYSALVYPNAPEKTQEQLDKESALNNAVLSDYDQSRLRNYQVALARLGG